MRKGEIIFQLLDSSRACKEESHNELSIRYQNVCDYKFYLQVICTNLSEIKSFFDLSSSLLGLR